MSIVIFESFADLDTARGDNKSFFMINLGVLLLPDNDYLVIRDRNGESNEKISREELLKRIDARINRAIELSKELTHTTSSGNVFADLGITNPDEALAKSKVVVSVNRKINDLDLSYSEAAAKIDIARDKLVSIMSGKFSEVSVEDLQSYLDKLS